MIAPRIDLTRHLALYTAFHRAPGNKLLHGVLVPVILFSMMCLQAYVGLPSQGALLHLGTLLSFALLVVLASVDPLGALVLSSFLLPASALAGVIVSSLPWWIVVPVAVAVHLVAWYGTVVVGHERVEPGLDVRGVREDSNYYFRRGYYHARDLGVAASGLDRLVQFCIAPLSVVQDALAAIGLRRALERAIVAERGVVLARMARGLAPLGEAVPEGVLA